MICQPSPACLLASELALRDDETDMVKTILLLVLCLPLAWIAWTERRKLNEVSDLQVPVASIGPDTLLDQRIRAEYGLTSTAQVKASVICLADPVEVREPSELVKALVDHGNARKHAREVVNVEKMKAEKTRSP